MTEVLLNFHCLILKVHGSKDFRDFHKGIQGAEPENPQRGYSSAGRAPALQAGGQEFDSPYLHQPERARGNRNELPAARVSHGLIAQVVRAHA